VAISEGGQDAANANQQRGLDSDGYGEEAEEEGAGGSAAGDGIVDEDDADNCSGPASPVLTPRLSPEVQAEGSQSGARLGQPSQPAQRRGVGRPRLSMRGVAGPHGVAGGTLRGGASSSAGHGTPSVHNWLLEQVELTAEETQVVEKCLSESSNATPTLDALCVLPEDKLGELLTPNKQRGLRALVTAALTDRRLALDLRTSVGM
jgi:hypothetical protein